MSKKNQEFFKLLKCLNELIKNEKSLFNSIATPKESRERIEIIADKDHEKFEFTVLEEKYKVSNAK